MTRQELKEYRKRLGLTQLGLARELKCDPQTISKWERGVHRIPEAIFLALELIEIRLQRSREAA